AATQQPQYAVGNVLENEHPALKRKRRYLLHAIGAAIDDARLGQPDVAPNRPLGREDTPAIVRLIAWQPHDLLRIVNLVARRHDKLVGDNVMVIGTAHRSGKPEPVHSNTSQALGKHACPRVLSVAVEIDQDIDVVRLDLIAGLLMVERADVDPMLRG